MNATKTTHRANVPNARDAMVLSVLFDRPMYGTEIKSAFDGRAPVPMPRGSLYVSLQRLKGKGWITESAAGIDPHRQFWELTHDGAQALHIFRAWSGSIEATLGEEEER